MAYIRCSGNIGGSIEKKTASGSVATFTTAIPTALADVTSVIGYRESGYTSATAINSKTAPVIDLAPYRTRINNNIGNLALEKLVGVSCVFNQLVQNGNFESTTGWSTWGDFSLSVNNNILTATVTEALTDRWNYIGKLITGIVGHKYFVTADIKSKYANSGVGVTNTNTASNTFISVAETWTKCATFVEITSTSNMLQINVGENYQSYQVGDTIEIKNVNVIDLTAMFGSEVADYIYTLESETAGAGVSLFKSLFEEDYYPYTANTLMSAKPTGKKIVGKNLFGGEYEKMFELPFVLKKGTVVTASCVQTTENVSYIYYYDKDQNLIDYWGMSSVAGTRKYRTFTIDRDCYYMRTYIAPSNDVQVEYGNNPTDFEPYSETTIVYSGNELRGLLKVGNNGLYCDGDIDDGSGNTAVRYEQRAYQSGDESLTDAITDGTNTVVKLATPTTAVSTAWSNPIIAKEGGTEEFTDSRTIKMFTGHDTVYGTDLTVNKAEFGATVYGGSVDFTTGEVISNKNADGTDKTAESISITPVPIMANYGANNLMSDTNGDTTVQYLDLRNSG